MADSTDVFLCPVCGCALDIPGCCPVCRGWLCPVCDEPAYRDESVAYDALGKHHLRCSAGAARPRPARMRAPEPVAEREPV